MVISQEVIHLWRNEMKVNEDITKTVKNITIFTLGRSFSKYYTLSEYVEPRPQTLLILTTCMTTTDWLPYLVHVYGAHFVCHDLVQEGLTFIPALVQPGQFSRDRVSIQRTEDYFLFKMLL